MRYKLLISTALLFLLFNFSSCIMRVPHGTPYKVWSFDGRPRHHWGAPKHLNNRHRYWGKHRYGPRPYRYRGRYH